ncbi:MAG TPA: hypothetical protein VMZ52_03750 [Bryobacteraceae bacterium]|nr:hypothetical protein [Bryobacteraceae bacterium]
MSLLPMVVIGLLFLAALLGWLARSRVKNADIQNRDELIKVKEQQLSSVQQQLQELRETKPLQVHQHLIAACDRLAGETSKLQEEIQQAEEKRRVNRTRVASEQADLEVRLANIVDLTERSRAVYNYEYQLRKLIDQIQSESHVYLTCGEAALRATAQEQDEIRTSTNADSAWIADCRSRTSTLLQQISGLDAHIEEIGEKCRLLQEREAQLRNAAAALLESSVTVERESKRT